jgi:serine/threonine protein kinase/Tfp pilus assembly protein PilF
MLNLGEKVGHIRVTEYLAKGGMGDVYVGNDEMLGRRVALKVIRAEHRLDEETKARFLREARILSQLEHPHICRIYDLIEQTDADMLVLELVNGKSLREAIRAGLDPMQRMTIARQILDVLTVAHAKAIIHRDLKPDNIMIDLNGDVKILDFGLARSIEELSETLSLQPSSSPVDRGEAVPEPSIRISVSDQLTQLGSVVGTLSYMSPEQARGETVTTACDMYSCGLLLQEIFTGRPAYESGIDRALLYARVVEGKTIRVSGIDADLAALIERLKSPAPAERPSARDSLDRLEWIRTKPKRKRKRAFVIAAIIGLALLSAFTTFQTFRARSEAQRANREATAARQVSDFMVSLFDVSDPSEARGNSVTAREILDRGASNISIGLEDQPLVQARLRYTMGRVYDSLGLFDQALPLLESALAQRQRLLGEPNLDVAESLVGLGELRWHKGEYDEALSLIQKALEQRKKLLGSEHPLVADILDKLGTVHYSRGEYDDAKRFLDSALAIRQKLNPESGDVANILNTLGAVAYKKGDLAEADRLWKQTLAIREKALGPDHPFLAQTLNNLAVVRIFSNDPAGARPLLERAVRIQEKVLGSKHPDLASGLMNLGDVAFRLGDKKAAKSYYTRAVSILEEASPGNPELARFLDRLAGLSLGQNDESTAQRLYERSLTLREKALGPKHHDLAESFAGLAECARLKGDEKKALELYERSLSLCRRPDGGYYPQAVSTLNGYSALLSAIGQKSRAAEMRSLADKLQQEGL